MIKRETPLEGEPGDSGSEYRHRFARRWQRKREIRATRHAWKFLALDLGLLAVVVILTWLLAKALE